METGLQRSLVGDAAALVRDIGVVVAPDAGSLSDACATLLANPTDRLGRAVAARRRIVEEYSVATCVSRYEALWLGLRAATPRISLSPAA